ncbi:MULTISPECIES: P pilus assembly protein, chaperone PapD [unclassified Nostoc]|uniref:P pilus assembly protein, chaperone PapD n=1 Tax=unclassified Nostoc TaxID=2593658 RepID=UPI002AD38782|nr:MULTISPECIES: P pilus assembly protein, chaperone PapD [unclassified Nostoc]MDZ8029510.1 P pilus assembly protein, chaperone PapD [Nostoc sp. DedSLP04]MDZ8128669.1 P pilus assembly protein, chaperone PapD [Nostoc sp. DedQUE07]MDZ8136149.1 P pilus assembly protein, chaperone PapD [Nostoc sp. DedQUE04]
MFSRVHKPASSTTLKAIQLSGWLLSAACLVNGAAWANLGASPLVIEAQANRGQVKAVLNVINSGDTPLRARVYTEPFTYSRDRGFQTIPSDSSYLGSYIQFSPRELIVPPRSSRRVRMVAQLAPSLANGEYRAVIFTEALNESTDTIGRKVGIITRVGTTVYVRKGDTAPNLVVDRASFNAKQKHLELFVKNIGNASVRPMVRWSLKQANKVFRSGELAPTAIIALGDRNLALAVSEKDTSPLLPGNYQLSGQLLWGEDNAQTVPFSVDLIVPAK